MPLKKADMFARYLQWCDQMMQRIEEVVHEVVHEVVQEVGFMSQLPVLMVEDKDDQHNKNEAFIAAIVLLKNPQ